MEEIDDIVDFFKPGSIISLFCRSKYTVKFFTGIHKIKYVQSEEGLILINKDKTYDWDPSLSDDSFLTPIPLETILEIPIISCNYNFELEVLQIHFKNGSQLLLKDTNMDGIITAYKRNENENDYFLL